MARMTYEAALRANPGLRALNRFVETCAGDDAADVMKARAEQHQRSENARAAAKAGQSLEQWLDEQHEAARAMGLADLEHLHPRTTLVHGELTYVARSGPDYRGVLRGGLAVAVEAKSAGRGRLGLIDEGAPRFDGVKAHQASALRRCVMLGGVALLVVRFRRQVDGRAVDTVYAVPWDAVDGRKDIGPDDVSAWRVTNGIYLEKWVR